MYPNLQQKTSCSDYGGKADENCSIPARLCGGLFNFVWDHPSELGNLPDKHYGRIILFRWLLSGRRRFARANVKITTWGEVNG